MAVLKGDDGQPVAGEALLTQKQLSDILGVSQVTIWRMNPPCQWVGKRKRFRLSEVMDFMQKEQATAK